MDSLTATLDIPAPAAAIFAVLADPSSHAAVDGTGWVRDDLGKRPITEAGQVFRVAMYHPNHPDGDYEMHNLVEVFDPPRSIAWKPGYDENGDGNLGFGGWVWRYDLAEADGVTTVTLTYDWSDVAQAVRDHIGFPPFPQSHLDNSLAHLGELVTG